MTVQDRCGQSNDLSPVMYFFFQKGHEFCVFLERKNTTWKGANMDKEKKKKFVRYQDGAEIYSMSIRKFQDLAKDAGAIYNVGKMALVNCEIFEKYLETFKL